MLKISGNLTDAKMGKTKHCTFRVTKRSGTGGGNNIAYIASNTKVQSSLNFLGLNIKWRGLSESELEYWRRTKETYNFLSYYTAFVSSFLRSVQLYGYSYTMLTTLRYHYSPNRMKRYVEESSSYNRFQKNGGYAELNSESYDSIQAHRADMASYEVIPVIEHRSSLNEALDCKLITRRRGFGNSGFGVNTFGTAKEDYTHWNGFSTFKYGVGTFGVND